MTERELWYIRRISAEEYEKTVPDRRVFFNEPRFTELNKNKADEVYYLIFMREKSARFGLIAGRVGDEMRTPFSAPYSYPIAILNESKQEAIDAALEIFEEYCVGIGVKSIRFIFPPLFYDEHFLSGWVSAFYRADYMAKNIDINYSLDIQAFDKENYEELLSAKARKHLRKAIKSGIEIIRCETLNDMQAAYDVVKQNHTAKNRPTHLSFEQLMDTVSLVNHEFFLAKIDGKPVAAMIYYQITEKIVQCIYSGYLLEYSNSGVMNYLTWYAMKFLSEKGFQKIDRATATEDSIPNYGLCDFKESMGFRRSLKYTFRKELK